MIRKRRIRLLEHETSTEKKRNAYKVLGGKTEGVKAMTTTSKA
jgi:hypothetical protein